MDKQQVLRERWVCRKCGKVFAEREITGPTDILMVSRAIETDVMCPKCGGSVRWSGVDESKDFPDLPGSDWISKIIACFFISVLLGLLGAWIGTQISGKLGSEIFSWIGLIIGGVLSVWLLFFKLRV